MNEQDYISRQLSRGVFAGLAAGVFLLIACGFILLGVLKNVVWCGVGVAAVLVAIYFARVYSLGMSRGIARYRAVMLPKYFSEVFGSAPEIWAMDTDALRALAYEGYTRAEVHGEHFTSVYRGARIVLLGGLALSRAGARKNSREVVFFGSALLTDIKTTSEVLTKLKPAQTSGELVIPFNFSAQRGVFCASRRDGKMYLFPSPTNAKSDYDALRARTLAILTEYRELLDNVLDEA